MHGDPINREVGRGCIRVIEGDLTEQSADAVVNAANGQLQHGGGVAGAIVRRGGPIIQVESNQLAPIEVGQAVITTGGDLPATHVIHAVGPRMGEGDEDHKLRSAVDAALAVAVDNGLATVVIPAISAGIFGFPIERSAAILIDAAVDRLEGDPGTLEEITFCLLGMDAYRVFVAALEDRLGR
jgi:O-acetyl-ADP-ribose deacetylase